MFVNFLLFDAGLVITGRTAKTMHKKTNFHALFFSGINDPFFFFFFFINKQRKFIEN